MKLTILLAVLIIAQQTYCNRVKRIVDGDIARFGQFKCQISLQVSDNHICGGCIISTHVLTAAHCVIDSYMNNMVVVIGIINITANDEKCDIKCIRIHPNYTNKYKNGWKHDIASDSGGPLIVDNELVGVVSWIIPCASGFPDIHTNVVKYLDFIKESHSMC